MTAPSGFKLFDHDALSGITTYHKLEDGVRHMFTTQDVEPILEANKAERYTAKGKVCERGRLGFKVARIPISIQYKWLIEEGWDCLSPDPGCQKKLRQKLNDPEWCHLRCAELVI